LPAKTLKCGGPEARLGLTLATSCKNENTVIRTILQDHGKKGKIQA